MSCRCGGETQPSLGGAVGATYLSALTIMTDIARKTPLREAICAAFAMGAMAYGTGALAQVSTLEAVTVQGDAGEPNWQKIRRSESRVRAIGSEPESVTLETTSSQHTSVVTRDELDMVSAMNTLDVLERVPGVTIARTGSLDGTIVLRGMDSSGFRVPMFINGDRFRGRPAFQFMMVGPAELERVEVIRGPASMRYGSDGLSGMVNFVTRKPKGALDQDFAFQGGQAEVTYRSNGNGLQGSASLEAAGNNFDFMGYVTGRRASDYKTPAGDIPNSHYTTAGAGFVTGYMPNAKERYELSYRYGEIKDGTSNANTTDTAWSRRDPLTIHQLRLGYEGTYDNWMLQRMDASLYLNLFESKLPATTVSNNGNTIRTQTSNVRGPNIVGGHVTFETPKNAYGMDAAFGVDFAHDHWLGNKTRVQVTDVAAGTTTDTGYQLSGRSMTQSNVGMFVLGNWEARKNWTLNAGGRFDYYRSDTEIAFLESEDLRPLFEAAKDSSTRAWTGSVGTSYFLTEEVELTASYGSGFRMPWHSQMFSSGWNATSSTYTIPNPGLKPEYSNTSEVGMRLHLPKAFVDIAAFDARYRNFLETVQTTYLGMAANQTQNVGRARIKGFEIAGKWQIDPRVNLHGSVAYVHGTNLVKDVPLSGLAPWSGSAGVQYVGGNEAWAITGEVQYATGQNRWDPAREYRTAGYAVVNLYGQVQLDKLGWSPSRNTQVVLGVTNLFNQEYRSASTSSVVNRPMSALNPLVSPGRSFNLTLRTSF